MPNPMATKLGRFAALSASDRAFLDDLCSDVRPYRAGQAVLDEGAKPEDAFVIVEGWAARYHILPDGSRQIMALLLPGDLCDVQMFILEQIDHSIGMLSDGRVATIPKERIIALFDQRPALARALWWSTLTDEAILRQWVVNVGRRSAYDRIAHINCELWLRLKMVGLTDDGSFPLPITQEDVGDAVGLTAVHVSRTLSRLRADGLLELRRGAVHIPDVERLMQVAGFHPGYLHLERVAAIVEPGDKPPAAGRGAATGPVAR